MKNLPSRGAKILFFDIETAPNLGWIWGKYEQNVIEFVSEWYMLCYSAKWYGDKKAIAVGLPDFPSYKRNPEDDKALVKSLWKLLDEADVVVAHNGDKFDIRKVNSRFLAHGLPVPSPYKTVDTLKVARKYFGFNSNKLDDLGEVLGVGRKIDTGGFKLWKGCMSGDSASWKKMLKYNIQDVLLLERVYEKMLPWMDNHPNTNLLLGKLDACPKCGNDHIQKRGFRHTKTGKYQAYQCIGGCGGWSTGEKVSGTTRK